jgi:hypothetical protein
MTIDVANSAGEQKKKREWKKNKKNDMDFFIIFFPGITMEVKLRIITGLAT